MPLILDKNTGSNSRLLLWKVDENLDEVISSLRISNEEKQLLSQVKLEKRQREFVGKYLIYQELGIPEPRTLENGKPIIDDGHISISHCGNVVGVIVSDKPVGIDIQDETPRLLRIKHKFCNQSELEWAENSGQELEVLNRIWCTKEAVFKMYGENILFAEQMKVDFDLSFPDDISCELQRDGQFHIQLTSFKKEGFVIVYTK